MLNGKLFPQSFFVIFVLILLLTADFYSQSYNWITTYNPEGTYEYHSSIDDNEGCIYTAYYSWNEATQIHTLGLVKHNNLGVLQWVQTLNNPAEYFPGYEPILKLVFSPSEKLFVIIDDSVVVISKAGIKLTSFSIGTKYAYRMFITPSDEVIISFSQNNPALGALNLGAAKYNLSGDILWETVYRENMSPQHFSQSDSEIDKDGSIFIVQKEFLNDSWQTTVIKITANGNLKWETSLLNFHLPQDIKIDSGLNVFVGGRSTDYLFCVTKLDSNGVWSWTREYEQQNGYGECINLIIKELGVFATGVHYSFVDNYTDFVVIHLTDEGNFNYVYSQQSPNILIQWDIDSRIFGVSTQLFVSNIYIASLFSVNSAQNYGFININEFGVLIGSSYLSTTDYIWTSKTHDLFRHEYNFTQVCEEPSDNSTNNYQLKLINYPIITTSVENEDDIRLAYTLSQNYPNPFNPTTQINYSIPTSSRVSLIVYDIVGREVKTLVNEFQNAGRYSVDFNAQGLASGIYFYRLNSGQFFEIKKLTLLK